MPGVLRPCDRGDALFSHIRDAVIVADAVTGRVVHWNAVATAIFGYSPDEMRDRPVAMLIPERLRRQHCASLRRHGRSGAEVSAAAQRMLSFPARHKDGRALEVEVTLSPLPPGGEGGHLVVGVIRDVTERRRLEAERDALLATEREYTRRLGELAVLKADFTAMVAHELANPIAAIRARAAMLAFGALDPDAQAATAAAIEREAALLAALVADVQTIARAERDDFAVRPRPVPVDVLLADAAAFARTLPGDHPTTVAGAVHRQVRADPERIGQVLRNLLGNAAKFSPAGTPIEVRALPAEAQLRLEVVDRGPGIHPYDLVRIFEKFGRGRDREGGSVPGAGLGLYLSRRIIQAHGSDLTVESYPGAGSVFGFELEVVP